MSADTKPEPRLKPETDPPSHPGYVPGAELLFGPNGLRPLWGIGLFYVLTKLAELLLFPLVPASLLPPASQGLSTPPRMIAVEGIFFLCAAAATGLLALIESRTPAAYGFSPRRAGGLFGAGLFWGTATLTLLVGLLRGTHLLTFDAVLQHGWSALGFGLAWLPGFLAVALFEETYLRGYLQATLTRGLASLFGDSLPDERSRLWGFWAAAVLLSIVFGAGHRFNPGETPMGLVSAALIGLVLCLSLWRTGSLWWAIGFHTAWDWAQSFLFGVGDSGTLVQGRLFLTHVSGPGLLSGGATGPEGSLYVLPLTVLIAAIVIRTQPQHSGGEPQPRDTRSD